MWSARPLPSSSLSRFWVWTGQAIQELPHLFSRTTTWQTSSGGTSRSHPFGRPRSTRARCPCRLLASCKQLANMLDAEVIQPTTVCCLIRGLVVVVLPIDAFRHQPLRLPRSGSRCSSGDFRRKCEWPCISRSSAPGLRICLCKSSYQHLSVSISAPENQGRRSASER